MSLRDNALNWLLWCAVFAWGAWAGGTLYQMLVVVPMWSSSPPESVRMFVEGTAYNQTIVNFFGPPFQAARVVPLVIALPLAWHSPKHRTALLIAVLCVLAIIVFTLFYIYPINDVLFAQAGGNRSPSEITRMVRAWIWADRLRFAVGIVAVAALLKAFRLPLPGQRSAA